MLRGSGDGQHSILVAPVLVSVRLACVLWQRGRVLRSEEVCPSGKVHAAEMSIWYWGQIKLQCITRWPTNLNAGCGWQLQHWFKVHLISSLAEGTIPLLHLLQPKGLPPNCLTLPLIQDTIPMPDCASLYQRYINLQLRIRLPLHWRQHFRLHISLLSVGLIPHGSHATKHYNLFTIYIR